MEPIQNQRTQLPCVCAVIREAGEDVSEQLVAPLPRRVHLGAQHRLRVLRHQYELAEALLHHLSAVALKGYYDFKILAVK